MPDNIRTRTGFGRARNRLASLSSAFLFALGVAGTAMCEEGVTLSKSSADVGRMAVGETKSLSFVLSNPTNSVMDIESVTSSCSCTVVHVEKTSLEPGQTTTLVAEIRHDHYVTPDIRSQITVRTKGLGTQETTVLIEGHLDAPFIAEPATIEFDGDGAANANKSFTLRTRDGKDVSVSHVEAPEWMEVAHENSAVTFVASLRETVPYDLLQGEITLWTDDPQQPVVRVPVRVIRQPAQLEVSPRVMMLGKLRPGQKGAAVVIRGASDSVAPTVTEDIEGMELSVAPGEKPGEYLLTPTAAATAMEGPIRGVVRLSVLQGNREQRVEIGMIGTVTGTHTD